MKNEILFHYTDTVTVKDGTEIKTITDIDSLVQYSKRSVEAKKSQLNISKLSSDDIDKEIKKSQPALMVYSGVKGEYMQTDMFFVDIDTTVGVDDIINNRDTLFAKCPWIMWLQKSYRGKLHICGCFNKFATTENEWTSQFVLYSYATVQALYRIFGYNYTELKDHKGKSAFDTCTSTWKHACYLSPNQVYVNKLCSPVSFDSNTISKLNELYKINEKVKISTDYSETTTDYSQYKSTNVTGVYVVDTSLAQKILGEEHQGNELRWMFVCFAKLLFKDDDKAKEWCDKHFVNKAHRSIWMQRTKAIYNIRQVVIDWLLNNKLIDIDIDKNSVSVNKDIKKEQEVRVINKGMYLSEFYDDIIEFVNNHNRCLIQAPTGVGKTVIVNGSDKYKKKHDESQLELFGEDKKDDYVQSLARMYSCDVITPFINMSYLYDNLNVITGDNGAPYIENEPNVMHWDKYLKLFEQTEDKGVIIDEAHLLFNDRTYRDAAVVLMQKLKHSNKRIILLTATPTGEVDELQLPVLRFTNERKPVNVTFVKTDNISAAELITIKSEFFKDKYDRIVVFDDKNINKLYEDLYFVPKFIDQYTVIRRESREKQSPFNSEYIRFMDSEKLSKRLTLCTCVAYNGINFKNENERILVICSFTEGETLYSELVQIIGRVRKSDVDCIVFYNPDLKHEYDIDAEIDKATRSDAFVSQNRVKDEFMSYNRRLLDVDICSALRRVYQYCSDNAVLNVVQQKLVNTGYVNLKSSTLITNHKCAVRLQKKLDESKYFIELLQDDSIDIDKIPVTNRNGENSKYMKKWRSMIVKLIENYTGITREMIVSLTNNTKKNKLIETTLDNLHDVCTICTISEEDYEHYQNCFPYLLDIFKNNQIETKRILSNHNRVCTIHDKWKSLVSEKDPSIGCDELMLEFIKDDVKTNYDKYIDSCAKGGTSSRSYKRVTDGTRIYNSVSDCAKHYSVPISTISKILSTHQCMKRGKMKNVNLMYVVENQ